MKLLLNSMVLLLLSSKIFASGSSVRGGGDPCEDGIKVIRNDLNSWITRGGSQYLELPSMVTFQQYSARMQEQIAIAKVRCVSPGNSGYPVEINGTAKVCRFDVANNDSQITCDFSKFQSLTESEQYVLIHHEYAGLAGIEPSNGDDSNYQISNQISAFLESVQVKKLVVKRPMKELKGNEALVMAKGILSFLISSKYKCTDSTGKKMTVWRFQLEKNFGVTVHMEESHSFWFYLTPNSPEYDWANLASVRSYLYNEKGDGKVIITNRISSDDRDQGLQKPGAPIQVNDLFTKTTFVSAPDGKSITKFIYEIFVYKNIGTMTNPQIGLPEKPYQQTVCTKK